MISKDFGKTMGIAAEKIFYLGVNLCAFILIVSLFVLSVFAKNLKRRVYLFFFLCVLSTLLGMLCDLFVELLQGSSGVFFDAAVRILDCLGYCFSGVQIIFFSCYLFEYLGTKHPVSKKPFLFVAAAGAGNILLAIAASFAHLYSSFDKSNNYIRQDTFWISQLLPALALLLCIGITLKYIKLLKSREWTTLLLYSVVPLACFALEMAVADMYIAYAGVAFTLFLIYVNIQIELKNRLREQEASLAESHIAVLLSQIQPHFIYNVLNTIDDLFYHDSETAHKAMYKFADYLRRNMDSLSQKALVPFCKELEHTREYLDLEKLRFEEFLNIVYITPCENFMLPALTLQPIVENAVRYGATKKEGGGTVTIRTEQDDECFRITVSDDGAGFDAKGAERQDGRSHVGIANVKNRLAAMCGGRLTITGSRGQGTTAVIEIPKTSEVVPK